MTIAMSKWRVFLKHGWLFFTGGFAVQWNVQAPDRFCYVRRIYIMWPCVMRDCNRVAPHWKLYERINTPRPSDGAIRVDDQWLIPANGRWDEQRGRFQDK